MWKNGVQKLYVKNNSFAGFLSLNRTTVAECVKYCETSSFCFCCNIYVLDCLYSMISSDFSLLVRDCNVIDRF